MNEHILIGETMLYPTQSTAVGPNASQPYSAATCNTEDVYLCQATTAF